jgi:hypothetical protein
VRSGPGPKNWERALHSCTRNQNCKRTSQKSSTGNSTGCAEWGTGPATVRILHQTREESLKEKQTAQDQIGGTENDHARVVIRRRPKISPVKRILAGDSLAGVYCSRVDWNLVTETKTNKQNLRSDSKTQFWTRGNPRRALDQRKNRDGRLGYEEREHNYEGRNKTVTKEK